MRLDVFACVTLLGLLCTGVANYYCNKCQSTGGIEEGRILSIEAFGGAYKYKIKDSFVASKESFLFLSISLVTNISIVSFRHRFVFTWFGSHTG